jgi:hypothetical protein
VTNICFIKTYFNIEYCDTIDNIFFDQRNIQKRVYNNIHLKFSYQNLNSRKILVNVSV